MSPIHTVQINSRINKHIGNGLTFHFLLWCELSPFVSFSQFLCTSMRMRIEVQHKVISPVGELLQVRRTEGSNQREISGISQEKGCN